jgi:Mg-chelatase subunit ChlI
MSKFSCKIENLTSSKLEKLAKLLSDGELDVKICHNEDDSETYYKALTKLQNDEELIGMFSKDDVKHVSKTKTSSKKSSNKKKKDESDDEASDESEEEAEESENDESGEESEDEDAKKSKKNSKSKGKEKDTKSSKSKDKPKSKKARSPYILFCVDKRQQVREENPDASFGEIGKLLGGMWKK